MSSQLEKDAKYEASVSGFLHRQWFLHGKPLDPSTELTERVAIITAANGGLGFEAARQLCQLRLSHLIITARSQSKGDEAAEKLRTVFKNATTINVWTLDMSSYDSITAFASRCETLERIDFVLLNAGIQMPSYEKNRQTGHETDLQVNYISTSLLAILLLPVLRGKKTSESPTPVLTLVTSDTAFWTSVKTLTGPVIEHLDNPANFARMANYSTSKLLLIMFVATLASKVSAKDVIINTINPGMVGGTSLVTRNMSRAVGSVAQAVTRVLARNVTTGAKTLVDAMIVQGAKSHGSYVSDWTLKPYPPIMYTEQGKQIQQRLWQETMEELDFAGVSTIIAQL